MTFAPGSTHCDTQKFALLPREKKQAAKLLAASMIIPVFRERFKVKERTGSHLVHPLVKLELEADRRTVVQVNAVGISIARSQVTG